jgi:hypothetical protein
VLELGTAPRHEHLSEGPCRFRSMRRAGSALAGSEPPTASDRTNRACFWHSRDDRSARQIALRADRARSPRECVYAVICRATMVGAQSPRVSREPGRTWSIRVFRRPADPAEERERADKRLEQHRHTATMRSDARQQSSPLDANPSWSMTPRLEVHRDDEEVGAARPGPSDRRSHHGWGVFSLRLPSRVDSKNRVHRMSRQRM